MNTTPSAIETGQKNRPALVAAVTAKYADVHMEDLTLIDTLSHAFDGQPSHYGFAVLHKNGQLYNVVAELQLDDTLHIVSCEIGVNILAETV